MNETTYSDALCTIAHHNNYTLHTIPFNIVHWVRMAGEREAHKYVRLVSLPIDSGRVPLNWVL